MGYNGYEQVLCKNGHLHNFDCYDIPDHMSWKCECGEKAIWRNGVDTTNGSWCIGWNINEGKCVGTEELYFCDRQQKEECEREKGRIDGYIELEIEKEAVYETCPTCNYKKLIERETYKIPNDKGHKVGE